MSLTARDVEEILKLLEDSSFDRLALEIDGMKLELERGGATARPRTEAAAPVPVVANAVPVAPAARKRQNQEQGLIAVPSPLLGIYYRAPKPGEPPFVEVGSQVDADTVIGIVEVMKLMNSVAAGVRGEVVEILGQNGALVEHGEALLLVRPRG